jgi:cytochrome c oxidase assembly factor CtaG
MRTAVSVRSNQRRRPTQALTVLLKLLATTGCAVIAAMPSGPALAHAGGPGAGFEQAPVWLAQALLALAWSVYFWGAVRRRPQPGPRLAFHAAMAIAALALFGPLDTLAERSSAWHMVQHMLLIGVVAPLAVLGRPLAQWRALLGATADALWRRLHRLSRHPLRCATLHAAAIWFWHAPGPYIAAVQNPGWHVLEHACFLFTGWLFWWSVLRPSRNGVLPAAAALLFTVMHTGLLGALLSFASVPLFHSGPAALADQQLAGLVMWIPGGLIYLLAAAWSAWRWLQLQETDATVPVPAQAPLPDRIRAEPAASGR